MTEADFPDNGATSDGPRRRRSTFTPPAEQREVPVNLGEAPAEDASSSPVAPAPDSPTSAPPPYSPEVSAPSATPAPVPPAPVPPAAVSPVSSPPPAPQVGSPPAARAGWDDSVLAPPERRSLSDEEIIAQMGGAGADSGALIAALEEQMTLRRREEDEFESWEVLIRQSFPEDEAEGLVARGRAQFEGSEYPASQGSPEEIYPEAITEQPAQSAMPTATPTASMPDAAASTLPDPQAPETESSETESPEAESPDTVLPDTELPAEASNAEQPQPAPLVEPELAQEVVEDSGPIVLPRWGQQPAQPDEAEAVVADEQEVSDGHPLPPTGSFERVLVDDEHQPATDAWPLAEQRAEGPDRADEATDWIETQMSVESLSVSTDSAGVTIVEETQEVVSIREALATKPAQEVPFDNLEPVPAASRGFDHLGIEPAPEHLRNDRLLQLLWAWWALGTPVPLVILGVWLVDSGLGTTQAMLAGIGGALLAAIPLVVGTRQGVRSGLPTLVSSRAAFGRQGNLLPAALMVVVRFAVAALVVWAASWMATGVLVESNYWNAEPALMHVILAAVFALIAAGIAITGRHAVTVSLWVAAALGFVALVGVILLGFEPLSSAALSATGGSTASIVAGISVVMSVLMVFWAHFGGDVARFQRSSQSVAAGVTVSAVAAVVPVVVLLSWGVLLGASGDETRSALLSDPFDTLLGSAPGWYPIPAIVVGAVPLVAIAGLAMHSSSYALLSLGARMPRYVAATIAGGASALAAIAVVVFVPELAQQLVSLALLAGVVVAAWVGAFVGEVVTRRVVIDPRMLVGTVGDFPAVRIAPLVGFIVSVGLGWGLVSASAPVFAWLGYLNPPIDQLLGVDLGPWQLGPLVALLLSLIVTSLAGIRGGLSLSARGSASR